RCVHLGAPGRLRCLAIDPATGRRQKRELRAGKEKGRLRGLFRSSCVSAGGAWRLPGRCAEDPASALARLETRVALADHEDLAATTDDLAVAVTGLGRLEGRQDFHGNSSGETCGGTKKEAEF